MTGAEHYHTVDFVWRKTIVSAIVGDKAVEPQLRRNRARNAIVATYDRHCRNRILLNFALAYIRIAYARRPEPSAHHAAGYTDNISPQPRISMHDELMPR
ncbi:hypothetical protein [Paraburkholderia sp.]|uniref:hypothetical protein n=1 Tax=Paraburkholderia sp. TaxID=1926495 RepID=UPI0039E5E7A2